MYTNSQPRMGFAEVTGDIVNGFILTKLVWIRNFFERLKRSGGATKEMMARARNNLGRRSTRSIRTEVSKLMGQKIGQISREIRAQQHRCHLTSAKVERAFGDNKQQYITIKRRENSRVWEAEKSLKLRKLEAMKPKLPEHINEIPLSDQKLEEAFGTPVVEVVALGGSPQQKT